MPAISCTALRTNVPPTSNRGLRAAVLALALLAASYASPAAAVQDTARVRVDALLSAGHADPAWFSASFLLQVPVTQVDAILAQITKTLGTYQSLDGTRGDYTATFAKGTEEVLAHVDAEGHIDGLLFKTPKLRAASLEEALRDLRPDSGTLAYVIVKGNTDIASSNASQPLAVGSAFKLAVLAALRDEIARGRLRWSGVAPLQGRWKSLPSGVLQTWPDGTPISLASYASEMISISDNTAADMLIHVVGSALTPYAGGNQPFLTTRQAFILKSSPGAARRAGYLAAGTVPQRAAILRAVDDMPLPAVTALDAQPSLGIEWHYSVRDLCALMHRVADLPLMSINPGVADAADFTHVAYKGGSDAGVLNLTTQVTTKRGATYCFSATVNDAAGPVNERTFELAYAAVLGALTSR